MPKLRTMPADFVDTFNRLGRNMHAVRRHYSVGQKPAYRWLEEAGLESRGSCAKDIPAGFAKAAPTKTKAELSELFGVNTGQINRWLERLGVTCIINPKLAPAPADFVEVAATMGVTALQQHYGVFYKKLTRWIAETGAVPKAYVPTPPQASINRTGWVRIRPGDAQIAKTRTSSAFDVAADTLRRHCPVYRCDDRGRYDVQGQFWRMGNALLTPDELLQRAERKRAT